MYTISWSHTSHEFGFCKPSGRWENKRKILKLAYERNVFKVHMLLLSGCLMTFDMHSLFSVKHLDIDCVDPETSESVQMFSMKFKFHILHLGRKHLPWYSLQQK